MWHHPVVRGRSWRSQAIRVGAPALACGLLAACGGGHAPARGFGSRQLLATRDPSLGLAGWSEDELITSTSVDGGTLYASINFRTGEVSNVGPSPTFSQAPEDGGAARFTCTTTTSVSGEGGLTITDAQSGTSTSIDGIYMWSPDCPSDENQVLVVARFDPAGALTLWAGPYDQLAQLATDLDIQSLLSFDPPTIKVLAARKAAPAALGIFALDVAASTTAEVVAPVLGAAAYADGALQGAPLTSGSLSKVFPPLDLGDHFYYARTMADGGDLAFVGPVAGAAAPELALVPVQTPPTFAQPTPSLVVASRGPALIETGTAGSVLRYWDDGPRRLVSCDLPLVTVPLSWSATAKGRQLLLSVDDQYGTFATGPLLLVSLDLAAQGTACSLLAKQDVASSGFSPGGTLMYWVTTPTVGNATLWTAAADGTAARMLGAGISIENAHFLDDTRLELTLNQDLVWLDVTEPEPHLHYIAEQVFGDSLDFWGRSIVIGYEFNQQDGTGLLGVVDRDTGLKKLISPSVVSYEGFGLATVDGGAGQGVGIAYIVRGRYPSPQDGLWLATLDSADLR